MSSTKATLILFFFFFFFFSCMTFLPIANAQGRAPHGLANENPMAFSPSAYEFFHPTTDKPNTVGPCGGGPSCSPLPLAAQVEAVDQAQAHESKMLTSHKDEGLGAGGIAGIVFGIALVVLMAMGAYYVVVTRRQNVSRAKAAQPDA